LGVILQYDTERRLEEPRRSSEAVKRKGSAGQQGSVRLGLIGAGLYAKAMLLPPLKTAGVEFKTIATASGVSARDIAAKYHFERLAADATAVIEDDDVNLVLVATRHDLHAELVRQALLRGRHVFVEKPLALTEEELEQVVAAARESEGQVMVGFNRRFSPLARAAKDFFATRQSPLSISYRINAGRIPREHWIQDPREGGGRIIGEVCHFIDLMHFLTGALSTRVYAEAIASRNREVVDEDSVFITLRFSDGSNGVIAYLAEGDKTLAKERVEIFGEGKTFVLDDFRGSFAYSNGREKETRLRVQDKGQADEVRALCDVVLKGTLAPIALDDLATTTRATFRIRESLRSGQALDV
ncbi:MAG TPA: Gfo/Idh/MocA family oxidoreductase, partial [Pyrinomonadaceae bacterium]|jgi:predicted dehydrogenase